MYVTLLPYIADSASIFNHFADLPYAIFIDSCGVGRFDIMVAEPSQVFCAKSINDDPFEWARRQLILASTQDIPEIVAELPFTVGTMGYFSYDLGFSLVNLQPTTQDDVGIPAAVTGFYEWSIVIDHQKKAAFLISLKSPEHPLIAAIKKQILTPALVQKKFELIADFSPNLNLSQYADIFNRIKNHIHAGDCYQINLALRFSTAYQGSPWVAYQRLRHANPMPMSAFINFPEGAILCLSPERFLQVNNGKVLTQPIKGTSPRYPNSTQDLLSAQTLIASSKDRAENLMIVDLLRNDLGKCCRPGSIKVPKLCALESFPSVHHLISTITGVLDFNHHPVDLLRHCFPGGSITGAPKRRAMEIIDSLEPHRRSVYCGSIAFCDIRGRMDSNIAIRTLLCNNTNIYCYGGGGIVNDSSMDNEYQEIQCKISRLLHTLETHNRSKKEQLSRISPTS